MGRACSPSGASCIISTTVFGLTWSERGAAHAAFSFAHPDDESFSGAGLACWCHARGARVVLACATRGEAGHSGDVGVSGAPADVGAAREQELFDAARHIGIEHVHLLGYRDRELGNADPVQIRRKLIALIRDYRSQVVATFDPNGFNLHPDHIVISRFTSDAIAAAADPRWFPELGAAHVVRRLLWTPPMPPWEAVRAKNLAAEAGADFVIDISRWRDRKAAALRAHKTQHRSIDTHFFNQPDLDRILSIEVYRQGFGPDIPIRPSADVFDGLS